ncbi:MAG: ATP-binding protein [Chloroflexota bacterium]
MVFDSDRKKASIKSDRERVVGENILNIQPLLIFSASAGAIFFILLILVSVLQASGIMDPILEITRLEMLSYVTVTGLSVVICLYAARLAKEGKGRAAFTIAATFMFASFYAVVIASPFGFYEPGLFFISCSMIFASLFVREENIRWISLASCGVIFFALALEQFGFKETGYPLPTTYQATTIVISFFTIQFLLRRTLYFLRTQSDELIIQKEQILEYQNELEDMVQMRTSDLISEKNKAIQANLAKSQFLANMSHELRTPLNAIIGYGEIVVEELEDIDYDKQVVSTDVVKIVDAGRNLLELINNVLDFSKIEANQMTIRIEKIYVSQIIYESVTIIEPLLGKTGNVIHVSSIEPGLSAYGDHQKLKQVLINLLGNANKFTEKGSIIVTVIDQAEHVKISVADTGIGMRPEFIRQLFQPFAQAENDFSRKFEGTGLGLAISKRFVELMNGTISVESKFGQGTVFNVFIPKQTPLVQIRNERQKQLLGSSVVE